MYYCKKSERRIDTLLTTGSVFSNLDAVTLSGLVSEGKGDLQRYNCKKKQSILAATRNKTIRRAINLHNKASAAQTINKELTLPPCCLKQLRKSNLRSISLIVKR